MNLLDLFVKISVDDQASKNVETIGEKIGKGLETAANVGTTAVTKTESGVEELSESVTEAASGVEELTEAENDNYVASEKLTGGVNTLSDKIGKGLEKAAKIGMAAVTAAASGVVALTKSAIDNYAEYEQLVGGVETLFKVSAGVVQGYAENAYKTAGLSANAYMETVTSFSASLIKSLDGDTETAAELAHRAIVDMSDNANKMGSDMSAIQNAYQGFAKQNYTMLDNLKLGYGGTQTEMARLIADASKMEDIQRELGITVDEGSMSFANIVNAISVMQASMDIAGTTSREAATTISGSSAMMKESWTNLITGMADENADFSGLVNNFVESVGVYAENLLPRIEIALNGVVMLIEGLAPQIVDALPGLVETVVPAVISAAINLVGAALDILPSLALTVINVLSDALVTHIPTLIPAVVEVVIELAKMLTDPTTLINIIDASVLIILALANGLIEALPELIAAAPVIIQNLVDALVYAAPLLLETGAELIYQIAEALVVNLPALLDAGTEIVFTIANGIVLRFGEIFQVGADIVEKVKDGFMDKVEGAKTWGKDLIDNFVGGIKEKWEQLKQTVSDVAQSIADRIGFSEPKIGPLSNFHTYAPDMMDLFAKGIRDNEHVVTGQIERSFDFGQRVIGFAESAQGKSSAAMINGMMLSEQSESKTYVAELYVDGEKVAESTYQPMKKIQQREGAVVLA